MAEGSIPSGRTNKFQEDTCQRVCVLFVFFGLGCLLVARFAASLIYMSASRGPFSAQNAPIAILVCHLECAPARSFAQVKTHGVSAFCSFRKLRALPSLEGCAAAAIVTLPLSPLHRDTCQSSQAAPAFWGPSWTFAAARVRASRSLVAIYGKYRWKNAQIPGVRT